MGRRVAHLALALGLVSGPVWAGCQAGQVELRWQGGAARFGVEIADDPAERAQGLMNRAKMASSAGMLFVYDRPQHAYFWMKDTLLPLDMLFFDKTGRVTSVHSDAVPLHHSPPPPRGGGSPRAPRRAPGPPDRRSVRCPALPSG